MISDNLLSRWLHPACLQGGALAWRGCRAGRHQSSDLRSVRARTDYRGVIVAGFPFAFSAGSSTSLRRARAHNTAAMATAGGDAAAQHRPQAQLCPGRTTARCHCLLCG